MTTVQPRTLRLEAQGGSLELQEDPRGVPGMTWTRCFLVRADGGRPHFLGAEAGYIIAERLVKNLADDGRPPTTHVDGQPARWVLSLAEAHHVLLFSHDAGGVRVLQWQDGDGRAVAPTLRLSPAQYQRWCDALPAWAARPS